MEATLAPADRIVQTRLRRRRAEEVDLRPWLHELQLEAVGDGMARLTMRLAAGQVGNLRPGVPSMWQRFENQEEWC